MTFEKTTVGNKHEEHKLKYGTGSTIRFNDEETDMINTWAEEADISGTSEAVKSLMKIGFFVTHGHSLAPVLSRLFKKERARRGN